MEGLPFLTCFQLPRNLDYTNSREHAFNAVYETRMAVLLTNHGTNRQASDRDVRHLTPQ